MQVADQNINVVEMKVISKDLSIRTLRAWCEAFKEEFIERAVRSEKDIEVQISEG